MEGRVDEVDAVLLLVEGHRGDRGHDDGHAEGDGGEEHDDVVGAVLEVQLLLGADRGKVLPAGWAVVTPISALLPLIFLDKDGMYEYISGYKFKLSLLSGLVLVCVGVAARIPPRRI